MVIEELTTRLGFQVDPNGLDKGKQALGGFKKWAAGIGIAAGAAFAYLAKTGVDAAMTMESITAPVYSHDRVCRPGCFPH